MSDPSHEVDFDYQLVGFGWSKARLALGDRSTRLTASYETDALGDLLNAVNSLCLGAAAARVAWWNEPGQFRWLFARNGDVVVLRVLWLDGDEEEDPDESGEERIAGSVYLSDLANALGSGARRLLKEHGEAGYLKKWDQHSFPMAALRMLERNCVS